MFRLITRSRIVIVFAFLAVTASLWLMRFGSEAQKKPAAPSAVAGVAATLTDNTATAVAPGAPITYTAVITSNGSADATGVIYNAMLDPNTTLVAGSLKASPNVGDDTYNVIGNVRIQPNAAQGLFVNDTNVLTGNTTGLVASGPSTSTQNGNVVVNADGSFSYNPAPGFAGVDTFTYTVNTGAGTPSSNGTVTLNVGNGTGTPGTNVVWFVNPAAAASGDGRLTNPFNCYTGAGCFSTVAADDPGDTIFLFSGAHTGGNTLLNNQKLLGAGATTALDTMAGVTVQAYSDPLPATGGANPTITTANVNAITLAVGNTLRGFTVGNTGTGTKIFGANFGTLNVGSNTTPDVTLNGTGKALDLTTGTFAGTSGFSSVTTTSSATQGINLATILGSIGFGSTTVSGSTTQGILVGTTTANINFGNTTVTGGTDGVSLQNNSGGTRTFGTLTVSGGSGVAFLHGAGGGAVTVNGLATLSNTTSTTIDIQNHASGLVSFAGGATLSKTGGSPGINIDTSNGNVTFGGTLTMGISAGPRFPTTAVNITGGTGTYSLGTVSIFTASFSGIVTTTDGTLNTTGGTLDTGGARALTVTGPAGLTTLGMTLGSMISNGGANNVSLTNANGTLNIQGGSFTGASGASVNATTTAATVTVAASITNTGSGISLTNNTGGTFSFTGGLNLSTGANPAFTATAGGTVNATQDNSTVVNTLATTTGTALNVTDTIGGSGLTFRSISVTGNNTLPTNGIILNNTGAGALKITGNTGACTPATPTCTGGTIQGTGSHGVSLTSASNIEFNLFQIHNTGDHGIFGDGVNNFTLRDSYIFGFGNAAGAGVSEDAMHFESTNTANTAAGHGLTGTVIIQRDNIGPDGHFALTPFPSLPENKGIVIRNHNDLDFNMAVTGTKFLQISNDGIDAEASDDADITANHGAGIVTVDGSTADGANTFSQINGRSVNFQQPIDSVVARTLALTIKNNTFDHVGIGGRWLASGRGTMNARYQNNSMTFTYDDAIRSESDAVNSALTPHAYVNAAVTSNTMGGGATFISLHRGAGMDIDYSQNTNIGGTVAGSGGCAACLGVHTGINLRSDRGSTLRADIQGNTGTADGSVNFAQAALDMQSTNNGGGNSSICANVGDFVAGNAKNILTENPDTGGEQVISMDPVDVGASITIQGGPGGSPGTENFLIAHNTLNGTVKAAISAPSRVPSGVGVDCRTTTGPPIASPANEGGIAQIEMSPANLESASALGEMASVELTTPSANNAAASANGAIPSAPSAMASADNATAPADSSMVSALGVTASVANERSGGIGAFSGVIEEISDMISPTVYAQDKIVNSPASGEALGPINVGTLAPTKSITITYQATVNVPPMAKTVSHQGTVSGSNFSNVLTDDPDVAGASNPTVTAINTLMTWNGSTSSDWNTDTNWTPPAGGTAYVPGAANPGINDVVIPNAGAQPNVGTTDIGIYSLSVANGRTLSITSPRILTIGGSPGGDLTLNGIISGGELRFGTGTHNLNNGGGTGSLSSTNLLSVISGSTVTLNNDLQAGALAVSGGGTMNITNRTLSLNGSGTALSITAGSTFTTTGSTVVFNGTAAQQTSGATFTNLVINNTIAAAPAHITGVTLLSDATVTGNLLLTSSDLDTGGFTLNMPAGATSGPASGATDVVGNVNRTGFTTAAGGNTLSFGNPFNTIKFTAGTVPTSVNILLAKNAPVSLPTAVLRSYTITQSGGSGFTATLRLHYRQAELNGNNEAPPNFKLQRGPTPWLGIAPTATSVGVAENNWLENNAVTQFSEWTFKTQGPTAANVSVSGRVLSSGGFAIKGARVFMTKPDGTPMMALTNSFGYYNFDAVPAGDGYVMRVTSKGWAFQPRVVNVTDSLTDQDFVANP
jgi:hypothetical protein